MALTAAQLEAILTLDKSQFDRAFKDAHGQLEKESRGFKNWGTDVGKAVNDGLVLAATGAAGLAATVGGIGVQYNTLQQQSRAALETLLGGVEEANAQMDKLDAWADNSPFAREIFYEAQQQLIGFGVEAELVVPILDGVQDAVAAVGGTNEDITQVVDTLANMQGTGRLTGEELRRLGRYGIDAATIIGDEMGKSGEEIRDMASRPGGIPVDQVWDPLTSGLTERFGGAAEAVKETFVGAMDRIRAATRDIGGEIARPFVDPNGGGAAVDWANDFADVLRAVEGQVPAVVTVLNDRMSPAFDTARVAMKDATDAINDFDPSDLEGIIDDLAGHLPAIAGLSGAMFTMATTNIPVIGGLTQAIGPLPAAIGAAALASPELRDSLGELWETGKPLIGTLADLAGVASGTLTSGLELTADVLTVVNEVLGPAVEWFTELPEPIRNAATAAAIFVAVRGPVTNTLTDMTTGVQNTFRQFQGWDQLFEGAGNDALTFGTKLEIARDHLGMNPQGGLRGALSGVMSIFGGPWGIAVMGATALLGYYAQEQADTKERVDELKASLDEQTGAFTEVTRESIANEIQNEVGLDTLKELGIGINDVTDAIMGEEDAHAVVTEAIRLHNEAASENGESLTDTQDKLLPLETLLREEAEALELAEEAARLKAEAQRRLNSELDEGERSHRRMTESLGEAVDETINMNDRVKALNDALDELHGATKTQEERDRELAGTQRDLGGFFENNAEAIGEMDENLIDMSNGLPSKTELGDQFNTMLQSMGDDAHEAALEQRDLAEANDWSAERTQAAVAEAYEPYIETLQDLKEQGHLTQEEVDALTNSIIGVPEVTSFLITHGDSVTQSERDVLNLIDQIQSTPDGDFVIDDSETTDEAIKILKDLGYEIEHTPDGEFKITPMGIDEAEATVNEFVNKPRSISVDVNPIMPNTSSLVNQTRDNLLNALQNRYFGGIDRFKGMADGGFSVMDFAQMVSPGDIRFAGDRSDVDEAWIPLDGSPRSVAILEEAIRRMPGYEPVAAEGMASGGITGQVIPPEVSEVQAPDTAELQAIWAETMQMLEDSTRSSFATIEDDTAASQEATTANTAAQASMMREIMGDQLALMVGTTATNMATMEADTGRHTANMRTLSAAEFQAMQAEGTNQTGQLRANTATNFLALQTDGAYQAELLRVQASNSFLDLQQTGTTRATDLQQQVGHQFAVMQADGSYEVGMLRYNSNTEFNDLQAHGIAATADLRAGVVSEMAQARSPFTGHVNNLVEVMRRFSEAMNDAYGDMGVSVGTPSRISAATGAILPGFNPGVDNHIFSSPTGGILELSGGEGVSRPEVVQAMGAGTFNALNAAAMSGGVAGVQRLLGNNVPRQSFASGGIMDAFTSDAKNIGTEHKGLLPDNWARPAGVSIIDDVVAGIGEALAAMFSGDGWVRPTTGRVTSRYGAGRGAYPHAGMDIADGHGTPVVAPTAMRILETGTNIGPGRTGEGILAEHMEGMYSYYGHNPIGGIRVKPGDLVTPGQRIGAQGNTGNSTGAHLHWEIHQGSPWNDVNPHPYWDAAGAGSGGVGLPGGGSDMYAGIVMQALRMVGLPTSPQYVSAWLRQGQSESGLNPNARQQVNDINMRMGMPAAGIVQVIPPTFAAHSLPGMKNIFNPLHNFAAGMNYAKNRYGTTGMLNVIGKGRGYEHGTDSAVPGWAWVGEAGPELVRFRGGEQVMTNSESRAAVTGGIDEDRLARKIAQEFVKVAPRGGQVHITGPLTNEARQFAGAVGKTVRRELNKLDRAGAR